MATSAGPATPARAMPIPPNGYLRAVSCASPDFCEAVGTAEDSTGAEVPLAEMWDGSTWSLQPLPAPAGTELTGVACTSRTFCEAVGAARNGLQVFGTNPVGANLPVAYEWDGTGWTAQPSAGATSTIGSSGEGVLLGVSCTGPEFCMAVGAQAAGGGSIWSYRPAMALTEAWDGASWAPQASPNEGRLAVGALFAVSCPTSSTCEATGSTYSYGGPPVTLGWQGGSWDEQAIVPASMRLNSISCASADTCEAVGAATRVERHHPLAAVEVWTHSAWVAQTTPPHTAALDAVACVSPVACEAAGAAGPEGWNGSTWGAQSHEPYGGIIEGISCRAANACVAVGYFTVGDTYFDSRPFAATWNGISWELQPVPAV